MTKRNLLLVTLLFFGIAITAPSMFAAVGSVWNVSNNTNYFARSEGDAEGVGTVTISSTSTGTIQASSYIAVDYNAPLAHNGTAYAVSITATGTNASSVLSCLNLPPFIDTYLGDFTATPPMKGTTNNRLTLTFSCPFVTVDATTTIYVASRVMIQSYPQGFDILSNVRGNGTAAYSLTIGPSPGYPQQLRVAETNFTYATATTVSFVEGPEYVLTCIGIKDFSGTAYDNDFAINIAENWANALTSLSDEFAIENDTWAGAPTNGSNILITLYHIPPGVGIEGRTPWPCEDFDPSSAGYCSGGNLIIEAPVAEPMTTGTDGLGVQSFWYVIDATNVGTIESANFGFKLWSHGPLAPNQDYQITAQVQLTDDYPSTAPAEMPYFTNPEDTPFSVVEFKDCVTKLLFPYVNAFVAGGSYAFSNFGTGINVANTTLDPFGLTDSTGALLYPDEARGSAIPQSGSCTFYFYPSDESAAVVYATPSISAGGSFAFDAGSAASGFQGKTGYAIAICNFQNGHGFAEIFDNYGIGAPTATLGYLADVLPDPAFYPRSPAGDGLGEGAIAPVNINHFLLKLLMKGISGFGGFGCSTTTSGSSNIGCAGTTSSTPSLRSVR